MQRSAALPFVACRQDLPVAYRWVPVCGAGRGARLRSRSAAFDAAVSAAEGAGFFFAPSSWAWVGGFGGGLWVCVPVRITDPLTNLYPSECTQTPLVSVQPDTNGAAGTS